MARGGLAVPPVPRSMRRLDRVRIRAPCLRSRRRRITCRSDRRRSYALAIGRRWRRRRRRNRRLRWCRDRRLRRRRLRDRLPGRTVTPDDQRCAHSQTRHQNERGQLAPARGWRRLVVILDVAFERPLQHRQLVIEALDGVFPWALRRVTDRRRLLQPPEFSGHRQVFTSADLGRTNVGRPDVRRRAPTATTRQDPVHAPHCGRTCDGAHRGGRRAAGPSKTTRRHATHEQTEPIRLANGNRSLSSFEAPAPAERLHDARTAERNRNGSE
jgi:hypothetical protein